MLMVLTVMSLSVFATSPLPFYFNFACAGGAYSDGHGGVWLKGQQANLKHFGDYYREARQGNVVLSISSECYEHSAITFITFNSH